MVSTRRELLATTAATVSTAVIAGCTGEGESTDTPAGDPGPGAVTSTAAPTETASGTMDESDDGSATVQVSAHSDLGEILVGPDRMTLYNFDSDTQGSGESTCYDGCAEAWPPLTVEDESAVSSGAEVSAELTTFEREDGSLQVAANGWPLYYFATDEEPGDVNGQGANDVWWVLRPDGSVVRSTGTATSTATAASSPDVQVSEHPDLGEILVGPDGMTLYNFDSDTQGSGESTCYDGCAEAWPPLTVDEAPTAGADVTADLTTFEREDGSMQVAADGWPLYYFANDDEPGDVNGQGANDVWWVLRPDGSVVRSTDTETETAGYGDR